MITSGPNLGYKILQILQIIALVCTNLIKLSKISSNTDQISLDILLQDSMLMINIISPVQIRM